MSVLVCACMFLFALGSVAMADAGSFLVARERAEAAADAAALAAAARLNPVLGQGGDPAQAAADAAQANGATLVSCECDAGSETAIVTVEIAPRVVMLTAWRGRRVRAQAEATLADWLGGYRT